MYIFVPVLFLTKNCWTLGNPILTAPFHIRFRGQV